MHFRICVIVLKARFGRNNMHVRGEKRSLTFAHWRSAADSARSARRCSAVLMSWWEAAKQADIQVGWVPSNPTHAAGLYSRLQPSTREVFLKSGMNYVDGSCWVKIARGENAGVGNHETSVRILHLWVCELETI